MRFLFVCSTIWSFVTICGSAYAGSIEFNRDIRPILSDQCFACHGPDSSSRKADLRLDQREIAIESGALVALNSSESELIRRILSKDPDEVMPPPSSHKLLSDEQKQMLVKWVDAGAEYQPHWSFIAPTLPDLPSVQNTSWVRNPIDRFVAAKLEALTLSPSPEADIRTLVRRVCLDLTGLPPTPDEIEEVVADPAPDRYERYVDRLLERPSWGEHRGRYWLDYARYADTHGIHFDNFREIHSFRDWVIAAFNANMPFEQFTIEQLAGDLLPNATLDQQIASGFNRCNITTNEGGIIDEEYAVLYARDRVETTSAVWMGLTTGCAVCHDHKFDPVSQREFYQLAAYFNNTTQNVRDGNVRDTPPIVHVPTRDERARYDKTEKIVARLQKDRKKQRTASVAAYDKWLLAFATVQRSLAEQFAALPKPTGHLPLYDNDATAISLVIDQQLQRRPLDLAAVHQAGHVADHAWSIQKELRPTFPELGHFETDKPFSVSLWVNPEDAKQSGSLATRMDEGKGSRGWEVSLVANKVMVQLIHKSPDDLIKVSSETGLTAKKWQHLAVVYDGTSKASGVAIYVDGKKARVKVTTDALAGSIQSDEHFRLGHRNAKSAVAEKSGLQDLRLYDVVLLESQLKSIADSARASYLATKLADKRSKEEKEELFVWYLKSQDKVYKKFDDMLDKLHEERTKIESHGTIAHVMAEKMEPAKAYVLKRGEYDKRGDEVAPMTPAILPPMPDAYPKNRLGLAKWLVMPEHPLMARVTVNRFWQEMFGQGLVMSAGDFGASGSTPTNLGLLDYLAVRFQEDHWNVKNLFRSIVTSATYRQSAVVTPEKLAKDPLNIYISRGPRFRMDAEMVRDYMLKTSGLLSTRIGGPSVRPYQPPGVWEAVAMPNSDTKSYKEDQGENVYRRSLYTFWKRAAPPASMEIFNAPSREVCTVRRERTNTPLQALVTMNDPQAIEAARVLAGTTLLKKELDDTQRIQFIATTILGRPLKDEEQAVVQAGLKELRGHYQSNSSDAEALLSVGQAPRTEGVPAAECAVWTMVVNQLLNLDEALCK